MRVLYVESAYGFGGSLTGLLHLFSALPSDVEPVLLTSFDPEAYVEIPDGLIHRQAEIPPCPEHPGHWLPGLVHYYRYLVRPWMRAVDRAIREFQPDIIHANNSASINLGTGLIGRRRGIPTISHQKDFEYPGRVNRWVVGRSCYTHHIATSDSIADHLRSLGLAADRCTRIYEPVSGPPSDSLAAENSNAVPIVAMHSMLVHWKGQHVVLRAAAEVRRRCSSPFRLVIAGGPPANDVQYGAELRALASELGIEDILEFRGHLRDVYGFLRTVDIAVHASIEPEPFGRVVPEAMLSGLPNVVTLGGGPAEYVVDGETGLHVPCGDVGAMADAVEKLLESPEMRRRMGTSAREFAMTEFDPATLAEQTAAVYRNILSEQRQPTRLSASA